MDEGQRNALRVQDFFRDQLLKFWWPKSRLQRLIFRFCISALVPISAFLAMAMCGLLISLPFIVADAFKAGGW